MEVDSKLNSNLDRLYGTDSQRPYYIYAPRWINSSAGIKALHYFCHALNNSGATAYLVLCEEAHGGVPRVNPNLKTPILTDEIADAHFRAHANPIVVYSETIPGNPLKAKTVVRYLMNYAGALGGPESFSKSEHVIAFSRKIADHYSQLNFGQSVPVLFIPPIDPREFNYQEEKENFQLIYAGKYRAFVGKPFQVGRRPSIEIFRDGPNMQSRSELKNLLRDAEVLYSFENSSIVTEALLSGTPAYFVPNSFQGDIIAEIELGLDGIMSSDTEEQISQARAQTLSAREKYYQSADIFLESLGSFIEETQHLHAGLRMEKPLLVPEYKYVLNRHRRTLALSILKNQGILSLMRVLYYFVRRRLSKEYWVSNSK